MVHRLAQLGNLVLALYLNADAEIALSKAVGGRRHLAQRTHKSLGHQPQEGQAQRQSRQHRIEIDTQVATQGLL